MVDIGLFAIFFSACAAAGATGSFFPPGPWYRTLSKPQWTPPDWVFPLAWTYLYFALAYAGARVAPMEEAGFAMAFWALQITLNTLWSPVFFGLQRLGSSLVIVGLLWGAVLGLLISLWSLDKIAFWVVSPYILWVTIATALNFAIWRRIQTETSAAPTE